MKELQTSGAACSAQPRNRATAQPRNSAGKSYSPALPGVGRIVRISGFQPSTLNQERIYGQRQPHAIVGRISRWPCKSKGNLLAALGQHGDDKG